MIIRDIGLYFSFVAMPVPHFSIRMMLTRARRNAAKLMEDNGYDKT